MHQLMELIFDLTSHFQDAGRDVIFAQNSAAIW